MSDLRQWGRYEFGQERLVDVPNTIPLCSDQYDGHSFWFRVIFLFMHMVVLTQGLLSDGEKKTDGV